MKNHKKTYGGGAVSKYVKEKYSRKGKLSEKQDATERTLRRRGCRTNNNELINCKCGGIVRNQIW